MGQTPFVSLIPGYPTKIVTFVLKRVRKSLTLRGWRCTDGKPLRFWYGDPKRPNPWPPWEDTAFPLTQQQLETLGSLTANLPPTPGPTKATRYGYGGYILFSSEGDWKIQLRQGSRLVGAFLMRVATAG